MKQTMKDIDYALARILLDTIVKKKGKLSYKEIAEKLSAILGRSINPHFGLSGPLANVSTLCFEMGLPLISAYATYSNVTSAAAGKGFYDLACDLKPEYRAMTPADAWKAELQRIRQCTEWDRLNQFLEEHDGKLSQDPRKYELEHKRGRMQEDPFYRWLTQNTVLSENSAYKYTSAVDTVSKEMLSLGVITLSLREMNSFELDKYIPRILRNEQFANKNKRGNNMYSNALKQFRYYAHTEMPENEGILGLEREIDAANPTVSERQALVLSRIGQGVFRQSLFEKYNGKCIITGIDHPRLLVASHIKPWAVSSNEERLAVDNGLLLSATYDRLFDNGLITFDHNGQIFLSALIGKDNLKRLQLSPGMQFSIKANSSMKSYLEYHADVLFIR